MNICYAVVLHLTFEMSSVELTFYCKLPENLSETNAIELAKEYANDEGDVRVIRPQSCEIIEKSLFETASSGKTFAGLHGEAKIISQKNVNVFLTDPEAFARMKRLRASIR
jgi:hypothetical protein